MGKIRFDETRQYSALCPLGHWKGMIKTDLPMKAINVRCVHCGISLKLMDLNSKSKQKKRLKENDKRKDG